MDYLICNLDDRRRICRLASCVVCSYRRTRHHVIYRYIYTLGDCTFPAYDFPFNSEIIIDVIKIPGVNQSQSGIVAEVVAESSRELKSTTFCMKDTEC